MDVIEIIKAIAEFGTGAVSLAVLAVVVLAWTRGRGQDNVAITKLAELAVTSQRGLAELATQTKAITEMTERVLGAIERGNAVDERMIEALQANTALVGRHEDEMRGVGNAVRERVDALQEVTAANQAELIAAITALEGKLRDELENVGRLFERHGQERDRKLVKALSEFNAGIGSMMQELQHIRAMLETQTDEQRAARLT